MSKRAREFLDRWEKEHVCIVPDDKKLREVVKLTAKCREDAVTAGITPGELRAAAAQDLIRDMLAAVAAANENNSIARKAEGQSLWRRLMKQLHTTTHT